MSKWALIIGGSSGIGLATCKKLGNHGFNLLIIHRDRRSSLPAFQLEIDQIGKKTSVYHFNLDATSSEKVQEITSELTSVLKSDKIDVVVHSLSRGNLRALVQADNKNQLTQQDFTLTFESMGTNLLLWIQELRSKHLLSNDARIVALTSAGSYRYWKSYAAVGVAKAALETLVRYLAVELAETGSRVNVIEAGITETPSLKMIPGNEHLISWASERNPSGRMTKPSDIADSIYLLTLPEANWINGAIIKVDGGEHLI